MFICSLKASKIKLFGAAIIAVVLICTIVYSFPDMTQVSTGDQSSLKFDGIKTEEQLQEFIKRLGIEVKMPAYNKAEIDIPRVFDSVYKKYNDIQKQQGLDLSKYRGKTLERYTLEVTNYPHDEGETGKVYLTLFLSGDKVVAGDISSRDFGGFVRTFTDFSRPDLAES